MGPEPAQQGRDCLPCMQLTWCLQGSSPVFGMSPWGGSGPARRVSGTGGGGELAVPPASLHLVGAGLPHQQK
jgi:hypothetical protein